jgi:hypothetical protein
MAITKIITNSIADTAISTAKIADDAVGNTKLDLSADYAFTGTITGAGGGGGKILQIQSTLYSSAFSQSGTANTTITVNNLSVSITPSATSSKIFLFARLFHEHSQNAINQVYYFLRGGTAINIAPSSGSRLLGMASNQTNMDSDSTSTADTQSMFTVDSPNTTSAVTYQIGVKNNQNGTLYVNRTVNDSNTADFERGTSEIIAMEVGA